MLGVILANLKNILKYLRRKASLSYDFVRYTVANARYEICDHYELLG